jgi:uncharacterized membrane protein YozB (DUF420 family)
MNRPSGHLLTHRALAAISVLLALMCAALAVFGVREHRRAECWRAWVEEDGPPPEGQCR